MTLPAEIPEQTIDRFYRRLFDEAGKSGYHLNPDIDFTKDLVRGLVLNENRYGYPACPCRLASGKRDEDLDVICPCDYRDSDLAEHDACYCGLYVSLMIMKGEKRAKPIPERRPPEDARKKLKGVPGPRAAVSGLSLPVWRCKVCGYLCAREEPPEVCPICKVKKERFEHFM
jgi:ferredoxin-thioredoxin reductase catalytic chain